MLAGCPGLKSYRTSPWGEGRRENPAWPSGCLLPGFGCGWAELLGQGLEVPLCWSRGLPSLPAFSVWCLRSQLSHPLWGVGSAAASPAQPRGIRV